MGNYTAFIARIDADIRIETVANDLNLAGCRSIVSHPELGLIHGLIKQSAPGDGVLALSQISGIDKFSALSETRGECRDDYPQE